METKLQVISFKNQDIFSWTFLIIIVGYLGIQLPYLSDMRPILIDEPVYASSVYNYLFKEWYIKTTMGSGGSSNFILPLCIALSFKIFGVSLFSARIVAVLSGLFFLFGLRRLFLYLRIDEKKQLIAFLTVIVTSHFVSLFRYVRPECLSVTFILLSVVPLVKYYLEKDYKQIVFVSIFLMLSFLSHPFSGVFFGIYGIFLLADLYRCKEIKLLKYIIVFICFVILSVLLLFLANMVINQLPLNSLISRTNLSHSSVSIKDRIMVFAKFWFLSDRIIFSFPFLGLLIYGLIMKQRLVRIFSIFGITYLLAALLLFGNDLGMTTYIFNYSIVFSVLLIPYSINSLEKYISYKTILILFFICFFSINLGATIFNNIRKYEPVNSKLESDLKTFVPPGSYILGPIEFWFSLPQTCFISYFHILNLSEDIKNRVEYVLVKEKDNFNITGTFGFMINDTTKYKQIYALKDSKNYGNIVLYKKR